MAGTLSSSLFFFFFLFLLKWPPKRLGGNDATQSVVVLPQEIERHVVDESVSCFLTDEMHVNFRVSVAALLGCGCLIKMAFPKV